MRVDGYLVVKVEDYEYGIQHYNTHKEEWVMTWTNHFEGWYPSEKSMRNALAQLQTPRYGRGPITQYRPVRRPVGAVEVLS
jgi:hypothetical protein